MPNLDECKHLISQLAEQLGWGNNINHFQTKLWYAVIELCEAGNLWKHRGNPEHLAVYYGIENEEQFKKKLTEEVIDAIFYCLHALHCLDPTINPDAEFNRKFRINLNRRRAYIDDTSKGAVKNE